MLDNEDLGCAEQLFGDHERSESVASTASSIADYVGVTKGDAVCRGRINASIHACYCIQSSRVRNPSDELLSKYGEVDLPTAYFFAGGRARSPSLKSAA